MHRERITDALDDQDLVERVRALVVGHHPPVAPADRDRAVKPRVVSYVGNAVALDGADHAAIHLRDFRVALVSHRRDVDRRAVHALIVDDLIDEGRYLVDRQRGAAVEVPLAHHVGRPLTLARLELQIVHALFAVLRLSRDTAHEPLADLRQELFDVLLTPFVLAARLLQRDRLLTALLRARYLGRTRHDAIHAGVNRGHPYAPVVERLIRILQRHGLPVTALRAH